MNQLKLSKLVHYFLASTYAKNTSKSNVAIFIFKSIVIKLFLDFI
jgi:hypothetical protein